MRLHEPGELAEPQRLVDADDGTRTVRRGVYGGDARTQGVTTIAGSPSATSSTTARTSPTSDTIEYSAAREEAP